MNLAKTYCECMEEIKTRIEIVRSVVQGSVSLKDEQFNYEFVAIQLRIILELIAFASLSANKDAYAKAHNNFKNEWNAKELLKKLKRVHPDFYPTPYKPPHEQDSDIKHFDLIKSGFLTRDNFVTLYDKCSKVIHTRNPFSNNKQTTDFKTSVIRWVDNIECLLKIHGMERVGSPERWVVFMQHPPDGRVHAFCASPKN